MSEEVVQDRERKDIKKNILCLLAIWLFTTLAYSPTFHNGFTNWDDTTHLLQNPSVRSLSLNNIKHIFTSTVDQVYIPLTILSFAIEYHFSFYYPFIYHFDNLLLHLFVVALIFIFALQCGIGRKGAFITSLIFGIHPMHVESVAWVTERKDVLYATFYMSALNTYWLFLKKHRPAFFIATILLGILSILSKPMALSLPLVLLAMDWFYEKRITARHFLQKAPHFLYIVPLTWITYSLHVRVPVKDFCLAIKMWSWSATFYIYKFLWPFNLGPYYEAPQPFKFTHWPYLSALLLLGLITFSLVRFIHNRWFIFSFLFFFLSMFFLFRFDVGKDLSIVADRFIYLPSLGVCLFLGYLVDRTWEKNSVGMVSLKTIGLIFFALISLGLMVKTYQQTAIWKNSVSLWSSVVDKGYNAAIIFNNRGEAYAQEGLYDQALKDYNKAIEINADRTGVNYNRSLHTNEYYQSFYNRANIYSIQGHYDLAMNDYSQAIEIQPGAEAYNNRGLLFLSSQQYDQAVSDFTKALSLKPQMVEAYNNRAYAFRGKGQYEQAIDDCNEAIRLNPGFIMAYYTRATIYNFKGEFKRAISDLDNVISADSSYSSAYYMRSLAYEASGEYAKALEDATRAYQLGISDAGDIIKALEPLTNKKRNDLAP